MSDNIFVELGPEFEFRGMERNHRVRSLTWGLTDASAALRAHLVLARIPSYGIYDDLIDEGLLALWGCPINLAPRDVSLTAGLHEPLLYPWRSLICNSASGVKSTAFW